MENTETITRLLWISGMVVTDYVLVLGAAAADMVSGIRKARKRGEATRSHALRRTVDKLARYYNVLGVLTMVDAMQLTAFFALRLLDGLDVPTFPLFTLLGALGMAFIEVKSIFEKGSEKERKAVAEFVDLLDEVAAGGKLQKVLEILKSSK